MSCGSTSRPLCPGCGNEIDPTMCGCGSPIDHGPWEGHSPVPYGCDCGRDRAAKRIGLRMPTELEEMVRAQNESNQDDDP